MAKRSHTTQGSWFPSGYYGHFRSKSRSDIINEYRQQAKPAPPEKFQRKLQMRPTAHQFSHHDNRFSFLNTVTSFQDGLGKKKVHHQRTGKFTPDFIAWVPHKREIEESGPVVSVYRETFRNSDHNWVPQILVPAVNKPKIHLSASAPAFLETPYLDPPEMLHEKPVTTYQLTHRHQQPNPKVNTNMNTGYVDEKPVPLQKTYTYLNPRIESIHNRPKQKLTSLRRARVGSAPVFRTSVADCLNWYRPQTDTTELHLDVERPKTVTGTFPELTSPCSLNQEEPSQPFQPRPPETNPRGTVCQSTAWGSETQPSMGFNTDYGMDISSEVKSGLTVDAGVTTTALALTEAAVTE